MLLYSFCSNYFTPLVQLVVPLLLLNPLHSSCSTYYSIPFAQPTTPLTWHATPLLLLDMLFSSCSTYCSTPLVQVPLYYTCEFATPCSSCSTLLLYSSCFKLILAAPPPNPPFYFFQVWKSYPNSSSLGQTWKVRIFVFNFCLLMSFFNYPCFWEMVVNNMFVFLCRNYLDIVNLIIHIAFHLNNCIVYFLSTLHFIFFQLLVNV
jgi:hypothetical protein